MKIVNRSYRYRFYPTDEQKIQLSYAFGTSRFVYNHFLKERTDAYYEREEKINYHKTSQLLTEIKNDENYCWLKDVSSVTLQQSLRDLIRRSQTFLQVGQDIRNLKREMLNNLFDMLNQDSPSIMEF